MSRRFSPAALAFIAIFALPAKGDAQLSRRLTAPLQQAARALVEGRFDEVIALTDQLDQKDPNVVALRARAAIARGKYGDAEAMLRPVASRLPTSEAALQLGLLQQMLRKPDAKALLENVAATADRVERPADLARAARALRALDRPHEASDVYREAVEAAPNDPAINTDWGELFLEKFQFGEALKSFQVALRVDPKWVPALMGSARTLEDEDPPQAVSLARQVLEINPNSVEARVFLARQAIDDGHRDEARQQLQKALAINPASLEAHSLLAGIAYIEDKDAEFQAEAQKVLSIAPAYGDVYRIAGELAAHHYRFDDAAALTRRALSLDPGNPRTEADLGLHLLRTGDEAGARTALEASFNADGFDRITLNLLTMLDNLDKFATIRDGDLVFRMSKDEAPVLQEYAVPLAHQALDTLSARYEFRPRGPILVEIFPKHDDFAVRNAGLPGMIGALGACFGRVVTMDSPKARPPGEFQWEATLWHELAHVVTLQMSNQRVPRWLTEGISVYEEKRARPEWGREMDVEFARLLNRGEAIKLRDLNAAFQNPRTISLAYFEASLLVEHLVTAFGEDGLRRLLRAYGQGLETDAALKTALETNFDQLQVGFDQSVERMFGATRRALAVPEGAGDLSRLPLDRLRALASENPRSYPVQMALGAALRRAGQLDEAMQAFERAAPLVPAASGSDSPHAQMAAIALERKDRARAIAELTALVAVDFNNVEAARELAKNLREAGVEDPARLRPVYQRILAVDPYDGEAHAAVGRMALAGGDADGAAREFRAVLALGPVDEAGAHTDLAESYYKAGKRAEAKKQTLAALEIAPTYQRAQELLLKLSGGSPER
jgi:tetratricopeptide (TPR) repeat protein